MACGCGRRGTRGSGRGPAYGPGSRMVGTVVTKTPTEMREIERQKAKINRGIPGNESRAEAHKRLLIERKRRAMILNKLGK